MRPPRCEIFRIAFYAGTFSGASRLVAAQARSGDGGYVTLTSVHGVVEAQRSPAFRAALDDAWLNLPDGVPVTWAQHRLAGAVSERVCGPDLLPYLVTRGQDSELRHYLFGSTDEVLDALRRRLLLIAPRAIIVGAHSPPFGPIDQRRDPETLDRINSARPDIVWVGLGAPKQELWMRLNARELAPAVAVGVGAAFDIVAGKQPRAPVVMQRRGLEWLYRLVREPRRLTRRYIRANSEYLARFAVELGKRELQRLPGRRPGGPTGKA